MKAPTILAIALALLSGCANYRPIVDSASIADPEKYEVDLKDCQRYADEVNPGGVALLGAVLGGVLGAAAGAIADDPDWALTAAAGAVGGLAGGGMSGAQDQKDVIRNCMSQRGYAVLK